MINIVKSIKSAKQPRLFIKQAFQLLHYYPSNYTIFYLTFSKEQVQYVKNILKQIGHKHIIVVNANSTKLDKIADYCSLQDKYELNMSFLVDEPFLLSKKAQQTIAVLQEKYNLDVWR